jgi:hypothetical protein
MFRVALDVHGVLDQYPREIRIAMDIAKRWAPVKFVIVSGPPREEILERLIELGFAEEDFEEIYSVVDWLQMNGTKMWQDNTGHWWCSDKEWWASKADICEAYNVDVIYDDSVGYEAYFALKNTKYVHVSEVLERKLL